MEGAVATMNLRSLLAGAAIVSSVTSCANSVELPPAESPLLPSAQCEAPWEDRYCVQIDIMTKSQCPDGFIWDGRACVAWTPRAPAEGLPKDTPSITDGALEAPHACAPGRFQGCTTQCQRGHADSCVILGVMFLRGQGVPADETRAANLFERACKADSMAGCNNLGVAFSEGQGRGRDYARAGELFRQACYGGTMHGCVNLGELYETGRGVTKDYQAAAARYEQACHGGVLVGCATLGLLWESGRLGTPDSAQAMQLYTQACGDIDYLIEQCDGGEPDGCTAYGICLVHGLGTPADRDRGATALQRGCQWGLAGACDKARSLGSKAPASAPPAPEML
jgi:TPR repeat protein